MGTAMEHTPIMTPGWAQNNFLYPEASADSMYPDPQEAQKQQDFLYDVGAAFQNTYGSGGSLPQSSHDELNAFFPDEIFLPEPASTARQPDPMFYRTAPIEGTKHFDSVPAQSIEPWALAAHPLQKSSNDALTTISGSAVLQHGRMTPGTSPTSPSTHPSLPAIPSSPAKPTASSKVPPQKPATKPRGRRSQKPPLSADQQTIKRAAFLRRNREAAHKCREKRKLENEQLAESARALKDARRGQALELEQLHGEVAFLRGLLLPHHEAGACADEQLARYVAEEAGRAPDWLVRASEARVEAARPGCVEAGDDEDGEGEVVDDDGASVAGSQVSSESAAAARSASPTSSRRQGKNSRRESLHLDMPDNLYGCRP